MDLVRAIEAQAFGFDDVLGQHGRPEVTEAAIKLARQYHRLTGHPGKYKIISRYQSWHGSTMGSLAASGLKSRKTVNEPLPAGFLHVFPPTCYRCPFGKEYDAGGCGLTCASLIEQVMEYEDPETVAAVMVEPIGHTGGVIDPPEEYLPLLREYCDRHNVLLIFDEVITGVGRTGQMFAAQTFGVTPDVLCTGKGMSGGYVPISAMIVRQPIADAFWGPIEINPGFVEGHTNEGHPVACAAAIAVLQEILERDLCANARLQGARMRAGFQRLADKYGCIGDLRGKGLFQAMEFVKDVATKTPFPKEMGFGIRVGKQALKNGLLCRFDPNWIAFGPPLVSTAEQIDEMLAVLELSLSQVLDSLGPSEFLSAGRGPPEESSGNGCEEDGQRSSQNRSEEAKDAQPNSASQVTARPRHADPQPRTNDRSRSSSWTSVVPAGLSRLWRTQQRQ
ncbi:MAG: aspartate aminotransferase family protein [Planctomycetales bacterium 12-60-4]|nr:MAG: aspartate aminotransferase family protein [Planctomycetales bacterium 12-60-4]